MVHPDLSMARPRLDLGSIDITEDADIRSPRTPIYQPTSSFSSSVTPFDPAKFFSNLSAPLTPNPAAAMKKNMPPLPSDPLAWVWQCHLCRSRWPLGVTRRCLVDGHFYCSGETSQPNLKKEKRVRSCSSEFDYVGWKEWGLWKRNALKIMSNPRIPKGCKRCEFPSQCRYEAAKRELIDNQPSSSPMTGIECKSTSTTSTTAEDDVARYYANENVTFESILVKAEVAGTSAKSKMTDCYTSDKELRRSKNADGRPGDRVAKTPGGHMSKKSSLSPVEEEASKDEVVANLGDLVMPAVDSWAPAKEDRK